jgi:hypothetical protein
MPPAGRRVPLLDQVALAELDAVPLRITVYRTSWMPERGNPDALHTDPHTNRFGTAAGTVYTASSPTVAWAETCRNRWEEIEDSNPLGVTNVSLDEVAQFGTTRINRLVPVRAVHELEFDFRRVVNLRNPAAQNVLDRAGLLPADLIADDYGRCRELATAAVALGWEGLLVPSAAWDRPDGYCVPVFKETGLDALTRVSLLEIAALPTLAVAHLTRYPLGRRPSWLP